jgi:putative ABC transport system permease protein
VKFALTGSSTMRVGGVYQPNALIGSYLVSDAFYRTRYRNPLPAGVLIDTNGDPTVEQAVKQVLASYPGVQVQTAEQFKESQTASVNQLLGLVYALLALAVIIALIGIVNTLMLSVLERTREIGLLRAVGMNRHQVRSMIRSESVILAIFGAIIGIVIGTLLGIALVSALRSQGITTTNIPILDLVIFLGLSCILGLVAATWPARRAARLDVLAAIASE